jgi:uncharacterized protein YabE (DUF348 family)
MNIARLRWVALAAALFVLAFGYLSLTRTVTVLVDGAAVEVSSRAVTVGGALDAGGVVVGPRDRIEPAGWMPIGDDMVIAVTRASRIQVVADGELNLLDSGERNPAIVLAQLGLTLGPGDRLLLAGDTFTLSETLPDQPVLYLELRRAIAITLDFDGTWSEIKSSAPTLGQALVEAGINLKTSDSLQPAASTPLTEPISAVLITAKPITISLGDEQMQLYSSAATVGDALAESGLALQGLDYSEPALDQALPADGVVRVVRVIESVQLAQEILPHDTDFVEDPEAELDTLSVVQEGKDGISASRTRVRYENGAEVARVEEEPRAFVEPQTGITGYGTKIVLRTAVVDGVTIEYYRAVTVFATYYTPCRSGVSGCLYGTSSGRPLDKGIVATWINWYRALNEATVYIPGYGPGVIGDVGAWPDRSLHWIDLAFSDAEAEANDPPWNNAYVTMYFTTPLPENIPLIWPP